MHRSRMCLDQTPAICGYRLGLLCILLVLMAGTIQVCHTHGANDASHPVCALCIAAHEVSLVVFSMVRLVVTTQARIVETAPWRNPRRFLILDLYSSSAGCARFRIK